MRGELGQVVVVMDKAVEIFAQRRRMIQLLGFSALSVALPFRLRAADRRAVSPTVPGVALGSPDQNGLRLLPGYQSRVIARSGSRPAPGSTYVWHDAPDGGATLATADGGWIYVSNSEVGRQGGGVGAVRFTADGSIIDAYSILTGTSRNCAGNMTPWGSYLSCEETVNGQVWECDPLGKQPAQVRPLLGRFSHESVVVEPQSRQLYLTEDHPDGRLYRFTAVRNDDMGRPDLSAGLLEVAQLIRNENDDTLVWHIVPDPLARRRPTRAQVRQSTAFNGGEGICFQHGLICFATKGDDRIWTLDPVSRKISILYDDDFYRSPILRGVDNVIPTPAGDLLVSEDGDDLQLVTLMLSGRVQPFLQLMGHEQSELTGLAFSPDGRRLYVSSQRGSTGHSSGGTVFEVSRSG